MKFYAVDADVVNKLWKRTKVQKFLEEFMASGAQAVRCVYQPGEYASAYSAQATYNRAIKRLGIPVFAKVYQGEMFLIRTTL